MSSRCLLPKRTNRRLPMRPEADEASDELAEAVLAELSADLVLDRDLTDMVSRAREQGYATYDDILTAMPTPEQSIEATDQLISYLGGIGVRVFDTALPHPRRARAVTSK